MANTAIIGIASWAETRSSLLDLATRIEADAPLPPADYHLNFADTLHLLAELPPRRLDTLREIKRSGPLSVYAVAKQLSRNYSNVVKTGEEASDLIRVRTAADDPVGAARLLQLEHQSSLLGQYATNTTSVRNSLSQAETTLGSINTILQRVNELALAAGQL